MQVKVLGSAAAEGWPAIFCQCKNCERARRNGGKDLRSRTSYLINGNILMDMGPDIYLHDTRYGFFTQNLEAIVISHTHEDHYNCDEFVNRREGMSVVKQNIELAGNEMVFKRIKQQTGSTPEECKLNPNVMKPGDTIELAGMQVTALRANHKTKTDETCLNYVFSDDNTAVLIANDTGWWDDDMWELINKFKLDIIFIDSTMGLRSPQCRMGHMGVKVVVEFRDKLKSLGCINEDTQVFANHFTHNGGGCHADLCEFFEPQGIGVGYDGLEVGN
jgi:phosphoribosyl 1,2-cyclic phosphate phosphodiesterase